MAIQLKAGRGCAARPTPARSWWSRRRPSPVDLRCGGHPFLPADAEVTSESIGPGFDGGTQLGKRYSDDELGLELLCTKAGEGAISVGETLLAVKGAKPLPASD